MSATRNPNLGPSQMRAKWRRLLFVRFYIVLFFLIVITIGLAIYSGHEGIKIQNITVLGNASVSREQILDIVYHDISGRYFYLFSKSNSLIFPRFKIKEDLLREIKTIEEVNISWEDWQTISISIIEKKPHSVWCGNDSTIMDTLCYFVDSEGYVYKQAPSFSGNIYTKGYGNILAENPVGSHFLSPRVYSQIYNLILVLDQNNITVVSVLFDGLDFKFTLGSGPVIIFNNKNDFAVSFDNFLTAVQTGNLDLNGDTTVISYIDLRYDNKIVIGKKNTQ